MKRIILIIASLALLAACNKDKGSSGTPDEPAVVVHPVALDLGLSVKWASCNIGADTPSGVGDLFAWGEVEPKEEYTWINYKWAQDESKKVTKYCFSNRPNKWALEGEPDNIAVLEPADDAAHVILGSNWRMPTQEELTELIENCIWTVASVDDFPGFEIRSKDPEFKDVLFIPAAGYKIDDVFTPGERHLDGKVLCIWSSSLDVGCTGSLCTWVEIPTGENGDAPPIVPLYRSGGLPIRAVCK